MATLKEKLDNFAKQHDAALDADTRDDSRFPASERQQLIDRTLVEQALFQSEAQIRTCLAMESIAQWAEQALRPPQAAHPFMPGRGGLS